MSGITFDDVPPVFIEWALAFFRNIMWQELSRRPKTVEEFDPELGVPRFLNCLQEIAKATDLGDELILMVPHLPFGEAIYMTASGFPREGLESYSLSHEAGAVGCSYAGTMGKIHIYTWQYRMLLYCALVPSAVCELWSRA